MDPDFQGTEAGPSTTGPVFRLSDSSKKGSNVRPVPISRPDLLRSRSLVLAKLMDKKRKTPEIPLEIESGPEINCQAVEWVLKNLQRDAPEGDPCLEELARRCVVLWKYECIPDLFQILGYDVQPQSSSGSSHSTDQQSSIGSGTSQSTTSRFRQGRKKWDTCRQLITIAIVLRLEEVLKTEIHAAIWGTNRRMDTILPLKFDIEARRKEELGELFEFMSRAHLHISYENKKLAKSIRATLKEHKLGNIAKSWEKNATDLEAWTPYEFLLGVENALSPLEVQTEDLEPQAPIGARDFRPINWEALFHRIGETININRTELEQQQKDIILEDLKIHVWKRKIKLVEELMGRRDSTVAGWKEKLLQLHPLNQKREDQRMKRIAE